MSRPIGRPRLTHYDKHGNLRTGRPPKNEESSNVARQRERARIMADENQRQIEANYPVCKCRERRIPLGSVVLGVDSCVRCGHAFSRSPA